MNLQTSQSPQSPDSDRQEPSTSVDQAGKEQQQSGGHCSREVQVPPTPTANHNQEDIAEEDTFSNSRMYLSGQDGISLFCPFFQQCKNVIQFDRLTEIDITHVHTYTIIITMISKVVPVCAEVLESFMATREAMQVQQSVTVYESFGTSTLPSSMESPVSPERELDRKQQWEKHGESDESLSFPAACHLVVSRCLFLLLGVRPAWVESSERENIQAMNSRAR